MKGRSRPRAVLGMLTSGLMVAAAGTGSVPAAASGPDQLNGSAYGVFVKVGLFGGPPNQVGATPVAVLPPGGGQAEDALPELAAQFGPAIVFGGQYDQNDQSGPSGALAVSTEGQAGADTFVTSSASVVDVGPGPLIADRMESTCRADGAGVSASATITGGVVETSYDPATQQAATSEPVPENPAPNTEYTGTLDHIGDTFRIVFNEQVVEGDTVTVRAAHMYLLGPIAVGDSIIGQSVCGLSPDVDGSTAPPTTAAGTAPPTTMVVEETTTTGASGEGTTTVAEDDDQEVATEATSGEGDDDSGPAGALVLLLVGAAVVGGGGFMVARRRRAGPAPPVGP